VQKIKNRACFFSGQYKSALLEISGNMKSAISDYKFRDDLYDRLYNKIKEVLEVERIHEIEETTHHDLQAFVQAVQENLDEDLKYLFHKDMTSFDTQEPALAVAVIKSMSFVIGDLVNILKVFREKASKYQKLKFVARSHGQWAELDVIGRIFIDWMDSLDRQIKLLTSAREEMRYSKISGAIGTYSGNLSPKLEERALDILGLKPSKVSKQIILRDRIAQVMASLSILEGVIENIALNIRLESQSGISEMEEPFSKGQKGSSRMPHKRNPVKCENLCGLARVIQKYSDLAMQNIATWGARDISHSSVERIILPGAFNMIHFSLRRLRKVIEGIVINEANIARNIKYTYDIIYSPLVKTLLMDYGMSPSDAYALTQKSAFQAWEAKRNFKMVLDESREVPEAAKKSGDLDKVFDPDEMLKHLPEIFARFRL